MRASDPREKTKKDEERPDSTGKAYERMVEDLFMGDSSEDEEEDEEEEEATE